MFSFYTPVKTPENQKFFCIFTGYKMETLAKNNLIIHGSLETNR